MKKLLLLAMLACAMPASAYAYADAASPDAPVNVLLAGSAASNRIWIALSPDGRDYVIDSIVPLEVGGTVCANPPDVPTELICRASGVASFEFNADGGDDRIIIDRAVTIPVTVRCGPGKDYVAGGGGRERLFGGEGADRLLGRAGNDIIFGGAGVDSLVGGNGNDLLRGGLGVDFLIPGSGIDSVRE
ncbi:MAG TPA: hypothetical protein VNM89_05140 [Solirubrobacterales bacterium]|nr:hypothetical protein [Solirubrobacterales bacterium]